MSNHNKELSNLLKQTEERIESSKTHVELVRALEPIQQFWAAHKPLQFNLRNYWILVTVGLVATFSLFFFAMVPVAPTGGRGMGVLVVTMTGIIMVLVGSIRIVDLSTWVQEISVRVFQKDIPNDLDLVTAPSFGGEYELFKRRFVGFSQGDGGQKVTPLFLGSCDAPLERILYTYYQFKYDHYGSPEDVALGFSSTSTSTRNGITYNGRHPLGVVIRTSRGDQGSYQLLAQHPTGLSDKFEVLAAVESPEAQQFVNPVVISELNEAADLFHGFCLEINREGHVSISFDDTDVLVSDTQYTLHDFDKFIKELEQKNVPKKMKTLFRLMGAIQTRFYQFDQRK